MELLLVTLFGFGFGPNWQKAIVLGVADEERQILRNLESQTVLFPVPTLCPIFK